MSDKIKILKLYKLKEKIVKRVHDLEKMLELRPDDDEVKVELEIMLNKIHKVDNEIKLMETV